MIGALRVINYFWIGMSVLAFVANSFRTNLPVWMQNNNLNVSYHTNSNTNHNTISWIGSLVVQLLDGMSLIAAALWKSGPGTRLLLRLQSVPITVG